jgi:hypothetical protein
LVAGSDNLVVPRVFASHEREIYVPDLGHVSMLFSPRVLSMVADYLVASEATRIEIERSPGCAVQQGAAAAVAQRAPIEQW